MARRRSNRARASSCFQLARLVTLLATVLILSSAGSVSAEELWQRTWVEVRSPHFVFVSALSESSTVDLLVDLENFRTAVEQLTNIGRFEERIPTHIYVLPHAVPELGFDGKFVGYFLAGMRANYAAIIPSRIKLNEVLKHEYTHFLIHNRGNLIYPTWFDEGFAQLLSTVRVHDAEIEFGRPIEDALDALKDGKWLPLDTVLNARGTGGLTLGQRSMFYAQSWLLMHFLLIGRPGTDSSAEITSFLRLRESGVAPVPAVERAFHLGVSTLGLTLRRYMQRLHHTKSTSLVAFPQIQTISQIVPPDRVAAELGLLAIELRRHEAAQRFLAGALTINPTNAMALVGFGDVLKQQMRYTEAETYYQKAIALEPTNALHELDYAEYFVTRAGTEVNLARTYALYADARRHFARSLALDPNNPETLAVNGMTYLLANDAPEKAVQNLEAAHALIPSQPEIRLLLAHAYAANRQPEKARPHLQALIAWADTKNAAALKEELDKLIKTTAAAASQTTPTKQASPHAHAQP